MFDFVLNCIIFTRTMSIAIGVTGVAINNCVTWLCVGYTRQLTAVITPTNATNQNVTWSSSNPAVLSVSSTGLVTAHSIGTATITVTTVDGNRTAQCLNIQVINPLGSPTNTTDPGVVINGLRWATRNLQSPGVFAPAIESPGRFFQRGTANGDNTGWTATQGPGVAVPGWVTGTRATWTDATDPCPPGWRVPTHFETRTLNNMLDAAQASNNWRVHELNGARGAVHPTTTPIVLTGNNPTHIFLPVTGTRSTSNGALTNQTSSIGLQTSIAGTHGATAFGISASHLLSVGTIVGSMNNWIMAPSFGMTIRCVACAQ